MQTQEQQDLPGTNRRANGRKSQDGMAEIVKFESISKGCSEMMKAYNEAKAAAIGALAMPARQIIFQVDGNMGQTAFTAVMSEQPKFSCVPLFDLSHGAGVLPLSWPVSFDKSLYHGYAGGLGPDNLSMQIPAIAAAAGDAPFWIDMETNVRSNNDQQFDLAKVERCLQIAEQFIKP